MKTAIDKFGRIVIPKELRDRMGITPGDALTVEESANGLLLQVEEKKPPYSIKDGIMVYQGDAAGSVSDTLRQVRDQSIKKHIVR